MKYMLKTAAALFVAAIALCGCDDDEKERFEGSDNHIVSFALTTTEGVRYDAAIIGDEIVLTAPENISLDGAEAEYEVCEQTVIFPDPASVRNWNDEHVFRVVARNGCPRDYTYTVQRSDVSSEGNVVLLTQADVEAFAATGVSVVEGNLVIGSVAGGGASDDPVTDLSGLSALTEVRHEIVINGTFAGTTLEGLENVVSAGGLTLGTAAAGIDPPQGVAVSMPSLETLGQLQINTPGVTTLQLPRLKSLGSAYVNAPMLSMADLSALETCDGHLLLKCSSANNYLTTLALISLERVRGDLVLEKYAKIETLALPRLTEVDGAIGFSSLGAVAELSLPELTRCGGKIVLSSLDQARRIALPRLTAVVGDLSLTGNTNGSAAESIEFPLLESVSGSLTVKTGAMSIETLSFPALRSVGGKFDIQYLKALTELDIPQLEQVGESVYLYYLTMLPKLDVGGVAELPKLELIGCYALDEVEAPSRLNDVTLNGASQECAVPGFAHPTVIAGKLEVSNFRNTAWTLRNVSEIGHFRYSGSGTAGATVLTCPDLKRLGTFEVGSGQYLKELHFPELEEVTDLFSLTYTQHIGNGGIRLPKLRKIGSLVFNGASYRNGATSFTLRTSLEDFAAVTEIGELTIKWWGALRDFEGLKNAAASVPEDKWHIEENALDGDFSKGYNPTREDILEGRYTPADR